MAITQGHGNPDWTSDEVILALRLYQEVAPKIPGASDARVIAFSDLLRRLHIHPEAHRAPSFRNPDGVSFKLQNIKQVALGKGMRNGSHVDREVWQAFGDRPSEVATLAAKIESLVSAPSVLPPIDLDLDLEFAEGKALTVNHMRRERSSTLRRLLLAARVKEGPLHCEGCGWSCQSIDSRVAAAAFEAHHLEPLAFTGNSKRGLKDIALLCANCHRMTHRWIAINKRWLTLEGIREAMR